MIARFVSCCSVLTNCVQIYPLLYAESRPLQQVAFEILHRQIPKAQEDISIDAALDKKQRHLPDELLSMIIAAPFSYIPDAQGLEQAMALPLRGYLLSWILIFDHFHNSVC